MIDSGEEMGGNINSEAWKYCTYLSFNNCGSTDLILCNKQTDPVSFTYPRYIYINCILFVAMKTDPKYNNTTRSLVKCIYVKH